MKKHLYLLVLLISLSAIGLFSCKKSEKNNPVVNAKTPPDVSNFSIATTAPYLPGTKGTLLISSSSLASGTYRLYYHCMYNNNIDSLESTINLTGGTATLLTPVLDTPFFTLVTIDSISDQYGMTSILTKNNLATLVARQGSMTASVSGTDSFKGITVFVDTLGTNLLVKSVSYGPTGWEKRTVYFDIDNYYNTEISVAFDPANAIASAGYYHETFDAGITNPAVYGLLEITSTYPYLTGKFSFTCGDSTKVNGSFTWPGP